MTGTRLESLGGIAFPGGLEDMWQCPSCEGGKLSVDAGQVRCARCHTVFPASGHRPVLIAPDNPLFDFGAYGSAEPRPVYPESRLRARMAARIFRTANLSRDRCLGDMRRRLGAGSRILVLGSGGQKARLQEQMGSDIVVIAVDVDPKAEVDSFADAHTLPFKDQAFDALITTAVLEHVLRPERVMEEVARVVKTGGYLYSEIPFMQQVHEGAYDFTRYTLSGHRRLASPFAELDSGAVAGPATALQWSVEYLLLALGGSRWPTATKALTRLALAWLAPVDRRIAKRPAALDGASGTYFYGTRRDGDRTPDQEIIASYSAA